MQDTTVEEGATLHLEVEVDACPEPSVKWLRNGKEVSADARIKISRDSKRYETYNMAVNLVKYDDQGEYEVVVTNSLGTVSCKSFVTVHSKYSFIIKIEVRFEINCDFVRDFLSFFYLFFAIFSDQRSVK